MKFVIVIPSYKNSKWVERNLFSAVSQNYSDFSVIYTDDCSPDGTGDAVQDYLDKHQLHDKVTLIRNQERKGAMHNLYDMIHSCDDRDIVVTLDGDDWLAHPDVLNKLKEVYSDDNIWFTWGSYVDYPGNTRGCSKSIPQNVIDSQSYRRHPWCTSHLRTFKAGLFKKIKEEDFKDPKGNFLDMAWDLSFYMPFVDIAGNHGKYIHDILYIYNNENPISDHKVNQGRQAAMDRFIRMKPKYPKIESL